MTQEERPTRLRKTSVEHPRDSSERSCRRGSLLPQALWALRPCTGLTLACPLFQGSAPILVVMVILLNIGVAILFINFFI